MRFAKPISLALLSIALVTYAFDCGAATTSEQAMQCCNSMPCSPHDHEHSQDCCKTMPAMHAPFVQSASAHGVSSFALVFALLPATDEPCSVDCSSRVIAAHCHAPPIQYTPATLTLRI